MTNFLDFIINQVFREPAIFLGIIALAGLVIQKKNLSDTIKGTMKTIIGVVILTQGTSILVNSILPLSDAFNELYQIPGEQIKALGADQLIATYGSEISLSMVLAFIINLIVARFTKWKNVFLTGHMLFWFPFIFIACGVEMGLSGSSLVTLATLCTAAYIIITPAIIKPYVRNVIGDDSFTLGHPTVGLSLLAGFIGKIFGDKSKSTEDMKFPKQMEFLKEITITSSIVIFLVYIVVGLMLSAEQVAKVYSEGTNLVIYSVMKGVLFGAGLTVLLTGVRMMLTEILPAFKGISDKIIPNAVPALDCPIIFPYAPNAVLIGFLVSMVTSIITLVILGRAGVFMYAVLPLTITCFFEIGTAGVIANGTGGRRGAILGTAAAGIVMILLVGFSVPLLKTTVSDWILIFGGNDFSLWAIIVRGVGKLFGM
ncbi:MAG: PTS ascorbate transporter subunit IIC [Clostridia bacterium BRH_c25]|nr:MAG: PTS ascorbate transporter subunit IIC [Clostridia bacterium BRH_c25]